MASKLATCRVCGETLEAAIMVKVDSPSRNYTYQCESCFTRKGGYHQTARQGFQARGKQAGHGKKIGYEFEQTNDTQTPGMRDLTSLYQWRRESDSSTGYDGVELVSPVYGNLSGHQRLFDSIESYGMDTEGCGHHINVSRADMSTDNMNAIINNYYALFAGMQAVIDADRLGTVALFGRRNNEYAKRIDEYTSSLSRYNMVNVTHTYGSSKRIEFRLPKFINAKQYMQCARFTWEAIDVIMNYAVQAVTEHNSMKLHKLTARYSKTLARVTMRHMKIAKAL